MQTHAKIGIKLPPPKKKYLTMFNYIYTWGETFVYS